MIEKLTALRDSQRRQLQEGEELIKSAYSLLDGTRHGRHEFRIEQTILTDRKEPK